MVKQNFTVQQNIGKKSACEYVFSPDASDWRDLNYKDRGKRDAEEDEAAFRDDRQFQTKLFGDVEVVVKGKFPTGKPQPPCN